MKTTSKKLSLKSILDEFKEEAKLSDLFKSVQEELDSKMKEELQSPKYLINASLSGFRTEPDLYGHSGIYI
ncbi:MAG: hypothetical protein ACOYT4_05150 [Nanoarchaeota archaeon]